MRSDPVTTSGTLTSRRRRGVQLVAGVAIAAGLVAVAAPWWAWAIVLSSLWLSAAGLRRMPTSALLTGCSDL